MSERRNEGFLSIIDIKNDNKGTIIEAAASGRDNCDSNCDNCDDCDSNCDCYDCDYNCQECDNT